MSRIVIFAASKEEEAVLVAEDMKEALLLLGLDGTSWAMERIGTADDDQSSDVLSRVRKDV